MSDEKTTKVYLMVEANVGGVANDPRMSAKNLLTSLIFDASVPEGKLGRFPIAWRQAEIYFGHAEVLPDDIKDILWRDRYNKMSPSQMLEALKEKWDAEAENEATDD